MSDDLLAQLLQAELQRQQTGLELIASENYVSQDVMSALGTVFTNRYSEGYPGKRYYGGQEVTDQVETLAIERAKQLFGADHANVQPHSGAQANEAAYHAWMEPGDTILAMDLSHGGHLTHGAPVTVLAKIFNFVRYGMKDVETGEIDYDYLAKLVGQHKPKIILAGYSGYPRDLDYSKFAKIAEGSGAVLMADIAHIAGLIAAGVMSNPFDAGFQMMTTTTHKTLRGPRGGMVLTKGQVGNPLKAPEKTIDNLPTLVDRAVFPGVQGGPLMNVVYAKAVAFGEALQPDFKLYAAQVLANARALADQLMQRGFKLVTNGTDNHLMQIDMHTSFGIDGKEAEDALNSAGLTCNKNSIPNDPNPPFRPSGLRVGTPAITTRGLKEEQMDQIAQWFWQAITHRHDSAYLTRLKAEVSQLAQQFPLP